MEMMKRDSFTSRLLLITSNDAILLLLAFFAYRNGLWPIAVLLAVGRGSQHWLHAAAKACQAVARCGCDPHRVTRVTRGSLPAVRWLLRVLQDFHRFGLARGPVRLTLPPRPDPRVPPPPQGA